MPDKRIDLVFHTVYLTMVLIGILVGLSTSLFLFDDSKVLQISFSFPFVAVGILGALIPFSALARVFPQLPDPFEVGQDADFFTYKKKQLQHQLSVYEDRIKTVNQQISSLDTSLDSYSVIKAALEEERHSLQTEANKVRYEKLYGYGMKNAVIK